MFSMHLPCLHILLSGHAHCMDAGVPVSVILESRRGLDTPLNEQEIGQCASWLLLRWIHNGSAKPVD
jgi:hypothetical protein